jgi:hypothetical protein
MDWESIKNHIQKAVEYARNPPQKGAFGVLPSPYTDEMMVEAERNREGVMLGEFNPKWRAKFNIYRQIQDEVKNAKENALGGIREIDLGAKRDEVPIKENAELYSSFSRLRDLLSDKEIEAAKMTVKPVSKRDRIPPVELMTDAENAPSPDGWRSGHLVDAMNPQQQRSMIDNHLKDVQRNWLDPYDRSHKLEVLLQRYLSNKLNEGGK